jgi:hypothetical protein
MILSLQTPEFVNLKGKIAHEEVLVAMKDYLKDLKSLVKGNLT